MANGFEKIKNGLTLTGLTGDPGDAQDGDQWYRSDLGKFRKKEGGSITDVGATGATGPTGFSGQTGATGSAGGGIVYGSIDPGVIITDDLTTYAWGGDTVGDNTAGVNRSSPVSVVGGHKFVQVTHRSTTDTQQYFLALDADGFAWAWGYPTISVGDNTTQSRSSPVSVVGDRKFKQVANGFASSAAALDLSGYAWMWGFNFNGPGSGGNLGDNTIANRSSPVSVVGGHIFKQISAGDFATAAIDTDGFAWSWGVNNQGQVGDNTQTPRSSPVSVIGGHKFKFVSCGATYFTAYLDEAGYAWAVGSNSTGELGDNTNIGRSSPVSVVGDHKFISLATGTAYTIALDEQGIIWGWGNNNLGMLGMGDTVSRSSPESINVGGKRFVAIGAGSGEASTNIAVAEDGYLWAWGENGSQATQGNVGDNTVADRSSPVSVVGGYNVRRFETQNSSNASLVKIPTKTPSARYYNSATSISGSLATIVWTTADYDTHNRMSSGTYTIPVSGRYLINAALLTTGTFGANNSLVLEIQKNTTVVSRDTTFSFASATDIKSSVSDIISCEAGDTIRVQFSSGATGPSIVSSNFDNYFSISKL